MTAAGTQAGRAGIEPLGEERFQKLPAIAVPALALPLTLWLHDFGKAPLNQCPSYQWARPVPTHLQRHYEEHTEDQCLELLWDKAGI